MATSDYTGSADEITPPPWTLPYDASHFHMMPYGAYQILRLAELIWPECEWLAFRTIFGMGNKAMRQCRWLSNAMNSYYLAPKWIQQLWRQRHRPQRPDLIHPRAAVAGTIKWIAIKEG